MAKSDKMQKYSAAERIYGGFTASKIRRLIRRAVIFSSDKFSAANSAIGGGWRVYVCLSLGRVTDAESRTEGCKKFNAANFFTLLCIAYSSLLSGSCGFRAWNELIGWLRDW